MYRCSSAYINNKNKSITDPKHIHWSDSIQHSDISNTSLHKGDMKNMHTMCEKCKFCQYYAQVKNNVSGLIRVMSFDGSPLAQFSMQMLDHFK